jgi:F-type H+-transporting ATPase subunit c
MEATAAAQGYIAIAAAIAIGLAALGGTMAQGKAASAALEGIARNPEAQGKIFTPMILGMALIESLVILGCVIAFMSHGII